VNALALWWNRTSARERRLITILGTVVALLLLGIGPVMLHLMLSSQREQNDEFRDVIRRLQTEREVMHARQAKKQALQERYANKAPKLGGFLEGLAKEQAIEVPELQDKPDVPVGKRYVENSTSFKMRKVSGYPFVKFLEKIETSGYPVAITRLNIRKRSGEHDSFDLEVAVSAYERNEKVANPTSETPKPSGEN